MIRLVKSPLRQTSLISLDLKPRQMRKVSRFGFGKFRKPPAQQKSRQEMTYLPATDLSSEFADSRRAGPCECSTVGWQRVLNGRLAASPSRWSAATAAGTQPAAVGMVKRRLAPVGDNRSAQCRLPGYTQFQEGSQRDRNRQWHNHQMVSKVEHSNRSRVTQHKHSPSIEQGVSWESFPQDSGRDRIVDSRIAENESANGAGCSKRSCRSVSGGNQRGESEARTTPPTG